MLTSITASKMTIRRSGSFWAADDGARLGCPVKLSLGASAVMASLLPEHRDAIAPVSGGRQVFDAPSMSDEVSPPYVIGMGMMPISAPTSCRLGDDERCF